MNRSRFYVDNLPVAVIVNVVGYLDGAIVKALPAHPEVHALTHAALAAVALLWGLSLVTYFVKEEN